MKKLIILGLFLSAISLTFSLVYADVILPNTHSVDRCVKIENLDKFPDIALIGYYTGPMIDKYKAYQIKYNECLTKGYKFNLLSIYWTTKEKFNLLDLNNLMLKKGEDINHGSWIEKGQYIPINLSILLDELEVNGESVEDKNPLIKETIEYSLVKSTDGTLSLFKSEQRYEYNNGKDPVVVTADPIETEPKLVPAKKGFWKLILCFFKIGKNC
jgi:hypothetical protein